METKDIILFLGAIGTLINSLWLIYSAWKRQKPEIKKLDIEADSEIVGAANLNLEGAKISAQMLLDRINELKLELDTEKKENYNALEAEKRARKDEQEIAEKARKEDVDYFRRRVRDLERETRDLRAWAAKLVKQVLESGQIPVPFIPTIGDSETGMTKVRLDLENKLSKDK